MQPRRLMSRIVLSLAAVSTAATLVAGCSSNSGESTDSLPDGAELLQQSSESTKKLDSAHIEINVDGTIPGLPIKTLSGDLTNVPATAVQGNATITMMGTDAKVDLVVIDGDLWGALTPDNWTNFGAAGEIYDPSIILNPDTGLANMLASFSDAKSESTEKINGVDTVKVTGTVSPDAVNKLIPQLQSSEPVPGTVWVQNDEQHNLVQAQLEPATDSALKLTLSKWNEPVTVTKPAG